MRALSLALTTQVVLISAQTWNPSGATDCLEMPDCSGASAKAACQKALNNFVDLGRYKSAATYEVVDGNVECHAQFNCNSAGTFLDIQGIEIQKGLQSVYDKCSYCGTHSLNDNCWVRILAVQNDGINGNSGAPYTTIQSTKTSSSSKSTKTSTTSPKPTTTSTTSTKTSSTKLTTTSTTSTKTITSTTSTTSKKTTSTLSTTTAPPNPPPDDGSSAEDKSDRDVQSAEDAGKKFESSPSTGLAGVLEDLLNEAIKSAKSALDQAVDESIKAATTELVQSLTEAAVAVAAAAAAVTAATTAAVTAAMESVSSSQEKVKKERSKKTTTAKRTTTSTSTTSSTTTSQSTSSSATCTPCQVCQEAEKRHATATAAAFARAQQHPENRIQARADRTVNICNLPFDAPDYESWHAKTVTNPNPVNPYSAYFTFQWKSPEKTCKPMNLQLEVITNKANLRATDTFATEHVYELQLADIFLQWAVENDPVIRAASTAKGAAQPDYSLFCSRIFKPVFQDTNKWPSTIKFAQRAAVEYLMAQFSGGWAADEMVYLQTDINSKKAQWAAYNRVSNYPLWQDELRELAISSNLYQYLRHADIVAIFHRVSNRMRSFYVELDAAIASATAQGQIGAAAGIKFADAYDKWVPHYFKDIDARWENYRLAAVARVRQGIAATKQIAIQKIATDVVTESSNAVVVGAVTRKGYFSPSLFSVADEQGLDLWYDYLDTLPDI
ncbi:hypothetical protein GQ53DRAFT_820976 [Thozetella sp. PMI_491]|nr:hypothetical protein GQ53DRAFT_820976 [Thozetella sp. PMI_491]